MFKCMFLFCFHRLSLTLLNAFVGKDKQTLVNFQSESKINILITLLNDYFCRVVMLKFTADCYNLVCMIIRITSVNKVNVFFFTINPIII